MSDEVATDRPRPTFGLASAIVLFLLSSGTYYVFSAAYRTGSFVLVAATFAALLTCCGISGIVWFRFAKRKHQRHTPTD
ncbi:hypothetical protein [Candidatus Poriferisodalis sp.]|uniref:hypothetical protein n=1 Tax=Candidatus Poriferisodalis sp. TaxID=3101277 RepID=UPI003B01C9A1